MSYLIAQAEEWGRVEHHLRYGKVKSKAEPLASQSKRYEIINAIANATAGRLPSA